MNNNPIGIFDSGIGGLTVVKEIVKKLPDESIVYIGDTARVPYGTRSKEVVTKFALELVKFLLRRQVKCLVVACNTISAHALQDVKKVSPVPVLDVIDPAVKKAVEATKNKRIGVIGTQGTIQSRAYDLAIKKLDPEIQVISCACPLFVPMAEEGLNHHKATNLIAREYLKDVSEAGCDTLILGCTHYPLLYDVIKDAVGDDMILIDSAEPTVLQLKKVLQEEKLLSNNLSPKLEFFVTDAPQRVFKVASSFFGEKLNGKLRQVSLDD